MGVINTEVNALLERPAIFADLINGLLHGGQQVLRPEDLTPLPLRQGIVVEEDGRRKAVEKTGDVRMKAENDIYAVTFFDETQAKVDYRMPVRNMLYDALEYHRQLQELEKGHRERGELKSPEQLLSGITREDRLRPVVNLVLYMGENWDGSRSLHEMLNLNRENERVKELLPYIADYPLNIVPVRAIENPENYKSCLQQIFTMLKLNQDKTKLFDYVKTHRDELSRMDSVEISAAFAMMGARKRLKELVGRREKGEEIGMISALEELILDGEKRGEILGEKRGEKRGEKQGEALLAALNIRLLEENRLDDLRRASSDRTYRRALYAEFGISRDTLPENTV